MLFNPHESRINGALVKIQGVLRDLPQPVSNAVSMLRTHSGKGAESHEVESTLLYPGRHFFTWYSSEHRNHLDVKWLVYRRLAIVRLFGSHRGPRARSD